MLYRIRYIQESTIDIEAQSEEAALAIAENAAADDWDKTDGFFESDGEVDLTENEPLVY